MKSPVTTIWVDTDIALGAPSGDVDDGFALAALLRAAELNPHRYRLIGISATSGNTDHVTAHQCADKLLSQCKVKAPLFKAGEVAANAIAELPDNTHLLVLGPLTNIAAALKIDPQLASRMTLSWVGVVVGANWRWRTIRRRCSNLNVRRDADAARAVLSAFAASGRAIQFPLDVVDRLIATDAIMNEVVAASELGRYISHHSQRWLKRARFMHASGGFPVWDLVATLAAIDVLPDAVYDDKKRLRSFNHEATWKSFIGLL